MSNEDKMRLMAETIKRLQDENDSLYERSAELGRICQDREVEIEQLKDKLYDANIKIANLQSDFDFLLTITSK